MNSNILIIEDDRKISKALTIRLKAAGCNVRTAEDALMGYQVAVKEQPDLILLDIGLPAGGGFSVAERLQTADNIPLIPIIFITASKDPDLWDKIASFEPLAFFEKPYDIDLLLCTIRDMMEAQAVPVG